MRTFGGLGLRRARRADAWFSEWTINPARCASPRSIHLPNDATARRRSSEGSTVSCTSRYTLIPRSLKNIVASAKVGETAADHHSTKARSVAPFFSLRANPVQERKLNGLSRKEFENSAKFSGSAVGLEPVPPNGYSPRGTTGSMQTTLTRAYLATARASIVV